MGGANLCDEYMIGGARRLWHDFEVRVQGPQVSRIQSHFDENWNWMALLDSQARYKASKRLADPALIPVYKPIAKTYPKKTPTLTDPAGEDTSLLLYPKSYRKPQAGEDALKLHVLLIDAAIKRIRIMTPYLVPPEELTLALERAAKRGVRIEVLTNSPKVNDAWPARYAALPHSARLIRSGISVYEYFARTLHGKGMMIDDDLISIGSHNFTNRSFRYNGESNLLTSSEAVLSRFANVFDSDIALADPLLEGEIEKRIDSWRDAGLMLISDFLEEQI
jgi:cardiolipin synthase